MMKNPYVSHKAVDITNIRQKIRVSEKVHFSRNPKIGWMGGDASGWHKAAEAHGEGGAEAPV